MKFLVLYFGFFASLATANEAFTDYCPSVSHDGVSHWDSKSLDPSFLDEPSGFLFLRNYQMPRGISLCAAADKKPHFWLPGSAKIRGALPFSTFGYDSCRIETNNSQAAIFPVLSKDEHGLTALWNVKTRATVYVREEDLAGNGMRYLSLSDLGQKKALFISLLPQAWTKKALALQDSKGRPVNLQDYEALKVIGREEDRLKVEYLRPLKEKKEKVEGAAWSDNLSDEYAIRSVWLPMKSDGRLTFWPMLSMDPNHLDERWVARKPNNYESVKHKKRKKTS